MRLAIDDPMKVAGLLDAIKVPTPESQQLQANPAPAGANSEPTELTKSAINKSKAKQSSCITISTADVQIKKIK